LSFTDRNGNRQMIDYSILSSSDETINSKNPGSYPHDVSQKQTFDDRQNATTNEKEEHREKELSSEELKNEIKKTEEVLRNKIHELKQRTQRLKP